ncbi:hypothetical protein [Actinoplanes couchii]|uniref:Uncharacterized protein n=1 Tax=Actinoplanes couchii TaxID=403638 RepID=A0ABQ3XJ07_9ACTN|nr:hypothetical protein [Actinoplanes couchii]MDR6324018.1 hypothetical protein [Actinoplanes couchii]GID58487.1 hypothetical protein Aco03nite_068910 [Actinoplanes couchii]
MARREIADRLLLVDTVDRWFHLDEPTFIGAGQAYWVDRSTDELCVARGDGRVSRHVGAMCR